MSDFFKSKIDQANWQQAKQTVADRLAKSEEHFSAKEWGAVHAEYNQLQKGIKEIATSALVGAAALAPNVTGNSSAQAMPRQQQAAVAKPAVPSKIQLHEDLQNIAQIESSGGKNKAHAQTNVGVNKGHTAGGATGLMPITIQEAVKATPELRQKYGHLLNMTHDKVTAAINNDESMENDIANHHWNRLHRVFGGDKSRMAFAWRNGITASKRATEQEIADHPYVQKFHQYSLQRNVASLSKTMTMGHALGAGATGGAALLRESLDGSTAMKNVSGKLKKKISKKKLAKAIDELDEMEALAKAAANDHSEVASIAVRNGSKILMGARRDSGRWTLPGGHLNTGEDKIDGAIRELYEESGIKANKDHLKYLGSEDVTTFTGKKKRIHAYAYDHQGEEPTVMNDPDKEVHEWHWIETKGGLPKHVHEGLHSPKNLVFDKLGITGPLEKSEDLEKMSRPMINFPNFSKLNTRPDQEVQTLETTRQKDLYGRKVANAEYGQKELTRPTRLSGSSTRLNTKEDLVNAYGKRISGKFDRNTLGLNHDTQAGPKAAAVAGKLRSKYEEGDDEFKEKKVANLQAKMDIAKKHRENVQAWYDKARELSGKLHEPGGREAYDAHIATKPEKPKMPRAPAKKKVATKDLTPEQQKVRGQTTDSTIKHEGFHYSMAEMEKHYGKETAAKVHQGLLKQYDPDTLASVGGFISSKLGYDSRSKKFTEEILAHSRDILTNPVKRQRYKDYAGEKADQHIKNLKTGHQKAYEFAQSAKPEDFQAPAQDGVKSKLSKAINRNKKP